MARLVPFNKNSTESFNLTEDPSPLINLPTELWFDLFSYLRNQDLKNLGRTCKFFNDLVRFPLMKKSGIHLNMRKIDSISKVYIEEDVLPFHSVTVGSSVGKEPTALKLLDKLFTRNLKRFEISENYNLFEWLAEKPLPNLKTIILHFYDKNKSIEFGNWRLGMYKKLEFLGLYVYTADIKDPLNLFEDLLNGKINLKKSEIQCHKNFKNYVEEISKVYENNGKQILVDGKHTIMMSIF